MKKQKTKRPIYISGQHEPPKVVFIILLILYLVTSVAVTRTSRSGAVFMLAGNAIPISAFTGVISSVGNICIIFMVVFFNKRGFIGSLILLAVQMPIFLVHLIGNRNYQTIPGLFGTLLTTIAIILIYRRNNKIDEYRQVEVDYLKDQQKISWRLFEQTATALVNAVDAKDSYSHGHSIRVAEYSEKIAEMMGKDEEECKKIYFAALLHDVGKIGIPNSIINKRGKLTDEEYEVIKQHPVKGNQILSSISEYPYLSIGAHYHHERYDGKGYPNRLKGEDIPEIARIISLADAYDAMSSNRSYRDALPQQLVREEIIKGSGTQFDPNIAKVMQQLIDADIEYKMKEKNTVDELAGKNEIYCGEYGSDVSDGIIITRNITRIHLRYAPDQKRSAAECGAAMIIFDSLDERVHDDDRMIREMCYFEYCDIRLDGHVECKGARKVETKVTEHETDAEKSAGDGSIVYDVEAVKYKDHILIKIDDGEKLSEITVALPDSSRYAFIGLTGEYCYISDVSISKDAQEISGDYITRIAEEISYINVPEGDIPNVQVDGYRTEISEGIPVKDNMKIDFHTMSLPTARLVWHCPYFVVYSSDDGRTNGANYREYGLVRLDGEYWEPDDRAENKLTVNRQESFKGWDTWREINKKGFDATVSFKKKGNEVTLITENQGIYIENMTTVLDGTENIYVALTGDQCALTNIRIS